MVSAAHAHRLAAEFIERLDGANVEGRAAAVDPVEELCRLATSSDLEQARRGTDALFRGIVEPLGDRFDPRLCDAYIELFSEVIDFCRRLPDGRTLDRKLSDFGLNDRQDLRRRADRVRRPSAFDLDQTARPRRIFVLSRVTLGADVAVTSVVPAKMKRFAPDAEIVLIGGPKTASFFASDSRVSHLPIDYRREGTLLDRLNAWITLTDTLGAEIDGLAEDEFLIVDPDSRLTQLGLLPLTRDDAGYCFLETRSFGSEESGPDAPSANPTGASSLPELTGLRLQTLFGKDTEPVYPYVSLAARDRGLGLSVREACGPRLAAVNLGVGSNEAKRLDDEFERELTGSLVGKGYRVLLDRGTGEEELARIRRLESSLIGRGLSVSRIRRDRIQPADVMSWEGSLSAFAGLISASALYVGYDSAGGHLAAALGVPAITVFAGAPNLRMRERWSPWGPSRTDVVDVGPEEEAAGVLHRVEELVP